MKRCLFAALMSAAAEAAGCALPAAELTGGAGGAGGQAAGGGGTGGTACSSDEVPIGELTACIDRYEASKGPSNVAQSKAGESPWVNLTSTEAKNACVASGKRLCTLAEWRAACSGPAAYAYPYGNVFDSTACNGGEQGGVVALTGQFAGCEGSVPGLFDMSGNVIEWTNGCDGSGNCDEAGGSFQNVNTDLRCNLKYTQNATFADAGTGFRCCRDP